MMTSMGTVYICNNAMAASVISIIIAIVLLIIDLHVPCVSSTGSYVTIYATYHVDRILENKPFCQI